MEITNKIFYSELPSRNVYVDSVVNDLPGYYPARSEFSVEYRNEIEQDLTDVCVMYDEIVHNKGEEEEDPLKNLLSTIKREPGDEEEASDGSAELRQPPAGALTKRKRKANEVGQNTGDREMKKRKVDVNDEAEPKCAEPEVCIAESSEDGTDDLNVLEDLCVAAIDIYNNRLRERRERKAFVRNHGFLDQKKIYSWYNIHNLELGDGLFSVLLRRFIKLFDSATAFDKFIQQLKLEKELRIKLNHLDELRSNGIRHKKMIPIYSQLKASRCSVQGEIKHMGIRDVISDPSDTDLPLVVSRQGKVSKMLEISHLPNYKCLSQEEKELCARQRLTPVSFLNFKQIMIDECRKLGALKLAQARSLLKIDVNKTRQVYNYLIEKKLIWQN